MITYYAPYNPASFPFHDEAAKIIVRAALATQHGPQSILNELESAKTYHNTYNHDATELSITHINKIITDNAKSILDNCGYSTDAVQAILNCLPKQ